MKYVAYYRVSTEEQGRSGLGLEAQQTAVAARVNEERGDLISEHTDIISGSAPSRPVLDSCLAECRARQATLVVAKLDRLGRNVRLIASLLESGVPVVAADVPGASTFVLHILAAVAQEERRLISERTKDALRAAKARGVRLGNPRIHELHEAQRRPDEEELWEYIQKTRSKQSIRSIARELNIHHSQVKRIIERRTQ